MFTTRFLGLQLALAATLGGFIGPTRVAAQQLPSASLQFPNRTGRQATFSGAVTNGAINFNSPFFLPIGQQFGGNDRSCASCHRPEQGWSVTPVKTKLLFDLTAGADPLFNPVDGTNAPNADRSTLEARRAASSLLLNKGLIRVALPISPTADFELSAVSVPVDGSFPADFAQTALSTKTVSIYRRPPPTSNVAYLTEVMWDGRETGATTNLNDNLLSQALHATSGHMQASGLPTTTTLLTPEQRQLLQDVVTTEMNLFAAQSNDIADLSAGDLDSHGALGGPAPLFTRPAALFQGGVFNLFSVWAPLQANSLDPNFVEIETKRSIARGENLFNTRVFNTNLVGQASCSTCHNNRGAGNSVTRRRFNLGLSSSALAIGGVAVNRSFPVYTLRRKSNGQVINSTDPGRILISGRWGVGDGDSFHVPVLRGLAARAPYFHGGQAATLSDVVRFYNTRFAINLSVQEQQDLLLFMQSL